MRRHPIVVLLVALASAASARHADALCTPRQYFELVVTDKVSPDSDPRNLTDNQGRPLGCAMSRDKSAAVLCAGANGSALPFQINIRNQCQLPVDVVLKVDNQHGSYSRIDFKRSTSCDKALRGAPVTLTHGQDVETNCTTREYAKEHNPSDPDYVGFFTIDVRKVGQTPTRNGRFDPQIAVERDGDVTSRFDLEFMLSVLAALGLGAVAGWLGRKWLVGAPHTTGAAAGQ